MKINDREKNIVYYTLERLFWQTPHKNIKPLFTRSLFSRLEEEKEGRVSTLWDLSYLDADTNELFLNCKIDTRFTFVIEEKEKDREDFLQEYDNMYNTILKFIEDNSFGHFHELPKPNFSYEEGFDLFCVQIGYR
uniref:hypothetical protein n=1 Tax=Pedobacter schmidteae TaxID=2201271 RepID=UPI000EAFBC42|nr:hypothetical protein [Pedobacter schmidteae]